MAAVAMSIQWALSPKSYRKPTKSISLPLSTNAQTDRIGCYCTRKTARWDTLLIRYPMGGMGIGPEPRGQLLDGSPYRKDTFGRGVYRILG